MINICFKLRVVNVLVLLGVKLDLGEGICFIGLKFQVCFLGLYRLGLVVKISNFNILEEDQEVGKFKVILGCMRIVLY